MAKLKFKILHSRAAVSLVVLFLRCYAATLRIKVENEAHWLRHYEGGGKILICGWHQQFYPLVCYFRKFGHLKPSVMISKSKDGEFIAQVCQRMGWFPSRGSSSQGGASALKEMTMKLQHNRLAAHILDGPRGPIGKVKKGAIFMAVNAGACIVPVYVNPQNAWFFRKSWDHFFVPKPFSLVTIRYGDMIKFETTEAPDQLEHYRQRLEDTMSPALHLAPRGEGKDVD